MLILLMLEAGVCVHYWTTQVIAISFRINYRQWGIIWSLFTRVAHRFSELFVYTVLDVLGFYNCNSLYADPGVRTVKSVGLRRVVGSNPAWGQGCLSLVSIVCCVGSGPCVGLISRPEQCSRNVCVSHSYPLQLQCVGRRGETKKKL